MLRSFSRGQDGVDLGNPTPRRAVSPTSEPNDWPVSRAASPPVPNTSSSAPPDFTNPSLWKQKAASSTTRGVSPSKLNLKQQQQQQGPGLSQVQANRRHLGSSSGNVASGVGAASGSGSAYGAFSQPQSATPTLPQGQHSVHQTSRSQQPASFAHPQQQQQQANASQLSYSQQQQQGSMSSANQEGFQNSHPANSSSSSNFPFSDYYLTSRAPSRAEQHGSGSISVPPGAAGVSAYTSSSQMDYGNLGYASSATPSNLDHQGGPGLGQGAGQGQGQDGFVPFDLTGSAFSSILGGTWEPDFWAALSGGGVADDSANPFLNM